ncbi:dynein regulatory complex subunit 7 isoform X4 [Hyla sarda]|uniref:dynein regulatory complex subunit 7 isoform X4 n=1 Tax=Hyla sarda TaxID=327740 RepID=UPI0024C25BFB|nr:dynein regulatory complex subunit 7 isoform X4 [Hyla sarda]
MIICGVMEALEEVDEHRHEEENILSDQELHHIQEHMALIEVTDAFREEEEAADVTRFPLSYTENSPKEQTLLNLAENFFRQYTHLYPDRKPLFKSPLNECGMEKFVCTTLRPTLLPYPELYNWAECAHFVSEFLTMEPLNPAIVLPRYLFSSYSILRKQKGNCFDFSILLCSLLLGAGYDAYCVSGYATREMCLMDETRETCPLLKTTQESPGVSLVKPHKKYSVRPPRQLVSKFELQQEVKKEAKIQAVNLKKQEEEERRLTDMTFDLGDPVFWEFMLLSTSKPILLIPDMKEEEEEEEEDGDEDQVLLQVPASWVLPIVVTLKEFETRCPQGKKLLQYKKAKLEKWAPYLQENGHISRLTLYQDTECTKELELQDWFQNRKDKLDMRQQKRQSGVTTEYFSPGRIDALKAHTFRSLVPETERTMLFYSKARLDGLKRREEQPKEMVETFQGRTDFLCYRHTLYGKRPKKVSIAGGPAEANPRPILKITERFQRNAEKPANEDVAERIFLITENRIHVRCHRQNDHITTSTWEFLKPANLGEKGAHVVLSPETCISYQVEPLEKFNKQLYVYGTLVQLQQGEQCAHEAVRKSEAEVLEILSRRAQEEADPQLTISIYDTERNKKNKEQRAAEELALQEERQRRAALELDYLAPYLALLGDPEKLTRLQAQQVKEDCLQDLKNRLIQQANLIQARFEKETQELQKKQQWYHQNQPSMNKEDEEAYLEYCSEAMFRIQILETRLNRHKELAPQKYLGLEDRLSKDPRLCEQLLSL